MADLKLLSDSEPRNVVGDWAIRGGVGLIYIVFGFEKFDSNPSSHWVTLFREIGEGDWFRYFTGAVEIVGGIFVLIPRTAVFGLALLGSAMSAAVLILIFDLHRPGDSTFPGIFLIALAAIGWHQRSRNR